MVRKQVFIREDQQKRLKALAAAKGVSEAELIRQGIDLVLKREEATGDDSWREAIQSIKGMWKDRDDWDAFDAERRRRRAERRKRMNDLMGKVKA